MSRNYKLQEVPGGGTRLVYLNRLGSYVSVPRADEVKMLLRSFHDEACAGHYASDITYRRIYTCFFWPSMRKDVYEYTRNCDICQKCQDLTEFKTEPLRPLVMLEPFELVTVDYSGPHNRDGGNVYCLYIIDNMTGWLEIMATRTATGQTTKRLMQRYCFRYGIPMVVHSDRGPHFFNDEIRQWAVSIGAKWVFGSPGTAKGQGKAERAIRSV